MEREQFEDSSGEDQRTSDCNELASIGNEYVCPLMFYFVGLDHHGCGLFLLSHSAVGAYLTIDRPVAPYRLKALQEHDVYLRKSNESICSIVPSTLSTATEDKENQSILDNTRMSYHELNIDSDLFTSSVYKRNYRNNAVGGLFKHRRQSRMASGPRSDPGLSPASNKPQEYSSNPFNESPTSTLKPEPAAVIHERAFSTSPYSDTVPLLPFAQNPGGHETRQKKLNPNPIALQRQTCSGSESPDSSCDMLQSHPGEDVQNITNHNLLSSEDSTLEANHLSKDEHDLLEACRQGDLRQVELLLSNGTDVHSRVRLNTSRPKGPAAIHIAAMHGHTEVAALLLKYGALVNDEYFEGRRPLFEAVERRDDVTAALLLHEGAFVNCRDVMDRTPLHIACHTGSLEMANTLVQAGGSVTATDENFYTPLHHTAQHCHSPSLILLLLSSGADIDSKTASGYTALQLACKYDNDVVVSALLSHGASLQSETFLKSPLVLATISGQLQVAKTLLKNGDNARVTCPQTGRSLIHLTVALGQGIDASSTIDTRLIDLLRRYGVDVDAQDHEDNTALHLMVMRVAHHEGRANEQRLLKWLLKSGAKTNIYNTNGNSVMDLAVTTLSADAFRRVCGPMLVTLSEADLRRLCRSVTKNRQDDPVAMKSIRNSLRLALFGRHL